MNYLEFKKQAGIGDAVSWGWDAFRDYINPAQSFGIWSPIPMGNPMRLDSYRVFTPFADKTTAFSQRKQPSTGNVYKQNMTPDQKMNTFQKDVRTQANKNIGVFDVMTNRFSKLKDKALQSNGVKAAADRFIEASDISDIAAYQKKIDEVAGSLGSSEQASAFKKYVADGMKSKVWAGIKENPMKNLPVAAGIFLRQIGLGGAGDFMSNPIAFYGSILAALLGGGAMMLGGRGDKNVNVNAGYNRVPYS